ncbi:MAG: hypothetical protein U0U69_10935 [Acidimicrobiia bacterium]
METLVLSLGLVMLIALTGVVVWTLVEAIRIPRGVYRAIGSWKSMWVVMLLALGPMSPAIVVFWLIARPRLLKVGHAADQARTVDVS